MKLKNKKTEDIGYLQNDTIVNRLRVVNINNDTVGEYTSLAKLNEEWEDYEEPKEYWYVSCDGRALKATMDEDDYNEKHNSGHKSIGNYFETKEEAEKAVEKLKAWKRLKDGGISFKNWTINQTGTIDCFATWGENIPPSRKDPTLQEDLDLLFGGEE